MENLQKIKEKTVAAFKTAVSFVSAHKIASAVTAAVALALAAVIILVTALQSAAKRKANADISSDVSSAPSVSSQEAVSSEPEPEPEPIPEPEPTPSAAPAPKPKKAAVPAVQAPSVPVGTDFKYNSNMSPDNNVFLDALVYTGYNLQAQRNSGLMWASGNNYVLCSRKRGLGWLSKITYGGGSTGYETVNGKPDIHAFEKKGLVCATYVTYVYFNYLPNVAGIDTSSLPRPERSYDANSWYNAALQWVNLGYSRFINFSANDGGSVTRDISFKPSESIPIGSIMCMQDWYNRNGHCTHVSIYAGYSGGYHWVTHVGNANGPEFCAMERMNRKPDPQWPLKIITPPSNIRFSASVEAYITDQNGAPMQGVPVSVKNLANGNISELGVTDANGYISGDGYSYGKHQIIQGVPSGYTCDAAAVNVRFTTQNNSMTTVRFTNNLIPPPEPEPIPEPEPPQESEPPAESGNGSQSEIS